MITNGLKNIITRWKDAEFISIAMYKFLNCIDELILRAYGTPKVHKIDCSFKIIVSSIDSSLHKFDKHLYKIIIKSIPKANSHVENNYDLVNEFNGKHLNDNYILISLDVVSLFINISIDLTLTSIKNKWDYILRHYNIPKKEFLGAVDFVFNSTYFKFNNQIFKQKFGDPL